jgi:hypothetical protein
VKENMDKIKRQRNRKMYKTKKRHITGLFTLRRLTEARGSVRLGHSPTAHSIHIFAGLQTYNLLIHPALGRDVALHWSGIAFTSGAGGAFAQGIGWVRSGHNA